MSRIKKNGVRGYDGHTLSSGIPVAWEPTIEKWERHPAESSTAWKAFQAYRDMPIGERSLKKLSGNGFSFHSVSLWSKRYRWVERCAAWEKNADKERVRATIARVNKMRDEVSSVARNGRIAASTIVQVIAQDVLANPDRFKGLSARETVTLLNATTQALRTCVTVEREALGVPETFGVITGREERERSEGGLPIEPTGVTVAEALTIISEMKQRQAIEDNPGVVLEEWSDDDGSDDE